MRELIIYSKLTRCIKYPQIDKNKPALNKQLYQNSFYAHTNYDLLQYQHLASEFINQIDRDCQQRNDYN